MTRKKNETEEDKERRRTYHREYMRRWYKANPEVARAKGRASYWKNPEAGRQRSIEARQVNPDVVRARVRDWARRNRNHIAAYTKKNRAHINARNRASQKPLTEQQKAAVRKRAAAWFADNRERARISKQGYYARNKEKLLAYARKWSKENPGLSAKYKSAKKCAIPNWVDVEAIKDAYKEAAYMQMEVDHIVPLQSKFVCGLHVFENLQILTKSENSRKGNRHWPDMP